MSLTFFLAHSSRARIEAASRALHRRTALTPALVVGATRAAADEFAFGLAARGAGLFDVRRASFPELYTKLAIPGLAGRGLSPTTGLGAEAIAARAAFAALAADQLSYFSPVAALPGFPRALSKTVSELRLDAVSPAALGAVPEAGADLAVLLQAADDEARQAGAVDRATLLEMAAAAVAGDTAIVRGVSLVLLDVPVHTRAEQRFVEALARAAGAIYATVAEGDDQSAARLRAIGFVADPEDASSDDPTALGRLQRHLFAREGIPEGHPDETVVLFSAPGEGRECVEIARRIVEEAARGVAYDDMAVLLRAPHTYLGLLEHAFQRAGIPSWFDRGTRRPDPGGRAFLALLACADEDLSARRFAEYLSLGQVPAEGEPESATWSPPVDEVTQAALPGLEQVADAEPEEEAVAAGRAPIGDAVIAGGLRAPWRWEELLVESAVIRGPERWDRRLRGLAEEYRRKIDELQSDEPESPRIPALRRDREQLDHLRAFALPLITEMAGWPRRADWTWGAWLTALKAVAPRVLRHPERVVRVLQELGPLADVGPVTLREVRDVLSQRLLTLTHEPPRRRHGRVFVGGPSAARGRAFRIVFVPGLAERVFPQRLREDPLLLDERRDRLSADLVTQKQRGDAERLQLRLAVGAASARVYLSWPRLELQESRQRVPSFYVLDIARAIEGRIPPYAVIRDRAFAEGGATLAWPAPERPERAIDDFEHDLAVLHQLLRSDRTQTRGRGRYLYELSPHLQRSLAGRWARWQRRWHTSDGLIRSTPQTAPALARQRLGARPYSLSALQRFSACPYQFQLSAMFQLAPLEQPAPLQRLDPLMRGSLFHEIQAEFFRSLASNGQLPVTESRLDAASKMLEWAIKTVSTRAKDTLAPAIDRVWADELDSIARDLRAWLGRLARDGSDWLPERFEWAFGLPGDLERDQHSVPDPALVDGRFLIRGSIDLVERRLTGATRRITDHKTGKNRTSQATMVDGGRVLQPILYGMAFETVTGERVESGRLSFCTAAGGFTEHTIALDETSRRRALEVLEVVDRAVEHGTLAAWPADGACQWCDFRPVCGNEEERRTRRKHGNLFADLEALRRIP